MVLKITDEKIMEYKKVINQLHWTILSDVLACISIAPPHTLISFYLQVMKLEIYQN